MIQSKTITDRRKAAGLCIRCGTAKPEGGKFTCGDCLRNHRKYYQAKMDDPTARQRASEKSNREKKKLRAKVIDHYGGKCACCGETEYDFLAIDHVNNDGNTHRDTVGFVPRWIIKNNFPPEFQILCANCNWSKHINKGRCIHQIRLDNGERPM